jgi:hypothetical protein
MRRFVWAILLSLAGLQAQDLSGTWQGTLGEGTDRIRLVLRIAKGHDQWTGTLFSIDQSPDWQLGQPLNSLILQARSVRFKVDEKAVLGAFEGSLDPAGASIVGAWIQGGYRQPMRSGSSRWTAVSDWKSSIGVDAAVPYFCLQGMEIAHTSSMRLRPNSLRLITSTV